jgi:hypothetical protein
MTTTLYCYDDFFTDGDAHRVQLELDEDDHAVAWDALAAARGLGDDETGEWVRVTDQTTGKDYYVASVACGAACHCAAQAVEAA